MYKLVKPCPEKAGVVLQCVLEQLDPCSRDHVSNNFSKAVPMTYELPADFGASGSPFTSQSRYIPCEQFHCQRTERPLLQYHYAKLQEPPWFTGVECIWPRGNACSAHAKPSVLTRYQLRSESLPGSALRLLGLGHGQSFCCYVTVTLTVNFVACSVGLQNVSNTAAGAIAHSFFHPCSSCAGPRQQKRKTCSLWKT